MRKMTKLIGKKFGDFSVVTEGEPIRSDTGRLERICTFRCNRCGYEKTVMASNARGGRATKCAECRRKKSNYWRKKFPHEYQSWNHMRGRCRNKRHPYYYNYGAKGIKVCKMWDDFENFINDMGERPEPKDQYSIDRIDFDGDYCPENCRWATRAEQAANTSRVREYTIAGESRPLRQWAEIFGINESTVWHRIVRLKWPIEIALAAPHHKGRKKKPENWWDLPAYADEVRSINQIYESKLMEYLILSGFTTEPDNNNDKETKA